MHQHLHPHLEPEFLLTRALTMQRSLETVLEKSLFPKTSEQVMGMEMEFDDREYEDSR